MIVDRFNLRILKEVAKITGRNDLELGSYVSEDDLISILEDLVCEIEILEEKIENP